MCRARRRRRPPVGRRARSSRRLGEPSPEDRFPDGRAASPFFCSGVFAAWRGLGDRATERCGLALRSRRRNIDAGIAALMRVAARPYRSAGRPRALQWSIGTGPRTAAAACACSRPTPRRFRTGQCKALPTGRRRELVASASGAIFRWSIRREAIVGGAADAVSRDLERAIASARAAFDTTSARSVAPRLCLRQPRKDYATNARRCGAISWPITAVRMTYGDQLTADRGARLHAISLRVTPTELGRWRRGARGQLVLPRASRRRGRNHAVEHPG
jgi:hypothetical protein